MKSLSCLLVVAILGAVIPCRAARAELVATESVTASARTAESDRARVRALLAREEVQAQMRSYGLSGEEAAARVEALTDHEIALIADQLDQVPAGGNAVQGLAAILLLGFLVAAAVVAAVIVGIVWLVKTGVGKFRAAPDPAQ